MGKIFVQPLQQGGLVMVNLRKLGFFVVLVSLLLSSCASAQNPPIQNPTSTEPQKPAPTGAPASPEPTQAQQATSAPTGISSQGDYLAAKVQRAMNPQVPESDQQALAAGNEAFAAALYQQISKQDGNLFFSPYSISLALAMVYGGARGQTETQMADTLHFTLPQDRLHPAFNSLDQTLESLNQASGATSQPTAAAGEPQGLQLNIANSIWGQKDFNFSQPYLDLLALNYGAGLRLADFINAPEPSRQEINNWVSDQTNGKIKDLFPQGSINSDTRLALANAIYFKASWNEPFQASNTKNGTFHLKDGSTVDVPMMKSGDTASLFAQGQGYQTVGLPYFGGNAMMVIVLPDQGMFDSVEASLNAAKLNQIFTGLQGGKVDLTMPKFTYSSEFGLADTLKAMGMPDAFDPSKADLSGIDGQKDLLISGVFHKAFVAVDEQGTEAAAATGISVGLTAVQESHTVVVDRPFLFYIYDQPTNTILFAGRVMNPSAQ
jgi:serpin B